MLSESLDSDVCVIGGGLTGLSAALHLAERGYRVALLEAARIGWGASGRNGGQVHLGYACDMGLLKRMLGPTDARRLWDLSLEAVGLLKSLIDRHRIDCDLRSGMLVAALKPRHLLRLSAWRDQLARDYDYHALQLLEREALREIIASERYRAAMYDPNGAHLHPLNYTLGLAEAGEAAGARLFEGSPAIALEPGRRPRIRTPDGEVRCDYVLLCGNAYLNPLVPAIRRTIMPVATYLIATEPLGAERAAGLIRTGAAVSDMQFVLDYYRLSADHRLLFGGGVSYSTLDPLNLESHMRRRMLKVFPQLANVAIDYCWGGYVAITMNRAPHFGRVNGNTFFAHGFSGHGLALTGLAGRLMAEAVAGSAERFDLLTRIRHRDFPGGRLLRTPLLVLATTWYRLRDLL